MFIASWLSAALVCLTGLYVLLQGDWRKHQLKYAAVCVSTVSGLEMVMLLISQGAGVTTCTHAAFVCLGFRLYHLARNIAFVLFHIAVGRDAIQVKKGDRRCSMNEKPGF